MLKTRYSVILLLLTVACLALTFTLSSARPNAEAAAGPGDAYTASPFNTDSAELNGSQPESSGTMMMAYEEHRCVRHCRRHYEERLAECAAPGNPFHFRCEAWAREREKECLDSCYREFPR